MKKAKERLKNKVELGIENKLKIFANLIVDRLVEDQKSGKLYTRCKK